MTSALESCPEILRQLQAAYSHWRRSFPNAEQRGYYQGLLIAHAQHTHGAVRRELLFLSTNFRLHK